MARGRWLHWVCCVVLAVFGLALTNACTSAGGAVDEGESDLSVILAAAPIEFVDRPPVTASIRWRKSDRDTAPVGLTAADGSGLELVALRAEVVIQDPLAFTQLSLEFDNPQRREREGRFEIVLPPEAAVSRLAMKIGKTWQEGEVVERARAQKTFEAYMHVLPNIDPALMENETGNRFSARVFPIPAKSRKHLILSYSQPLGREGYVLPLEGLPKIKRFAAKISVDGSNNPEPLVVERPDFTPDQDLLVRVDGQRSASAVSADGFVALRVQPSGDDVRDPFDEMAVLVDTSKSMQPRFEATLKRLGALIQAAVEEADFHLRVIAFDQTHEEIYDGTAAGFGAAELAALRKRGTGGASDLHAALKAAAEDDQAPQRILLVTDGIATAGPGIAEIRARISRLGRRGLERVDAMLPSGYDDSTQIRRLLIGALKKGGAILERRLDAETAAAQLVEVSLQGTTVEIDNAKFVWPTTLSGVHAGDDVMIYAQLNIPFAETVRVAFSNGVKTLDVQPLDVERPLVERAVVGGRIDRIEQTLAAVAGNRDAETQLRARMLQLSAHYRVVCDTTALIVLDGDQEYRRFGLDRQAIADILRVDNGEIAVTARGAVPPGLDPRQDLVLTAPDAELMARNAGIFGLMAEESGHFLASPYGDAFAVGNDDHDVWGGLDGSEVGEAFGVGGLGLVGTGRGDGTVGLGNIGLIGKGAGGGTGSGYGSGSGAGFGGRWGGGKSRTTVAPSVGQLAPAESIGAGLVSQVGTAQPDAPPPPPPPATKRPVGLRSTALYDERPWAPNSVRQRRARVDGPADSDIVRRIVRAHINEVRHCYNQALVRAPGAEGTLSAVFTIASEGKVPAAAADAQGVGLDSAARCLAKALRRWKFPRTATDSTVQMDFRLSRARRPRARMKRRHSVRRPHQGLYAGMQRLLKKGRAAQAVELAQDWVNDSPFDQVALLGLGDALVAADRGHEAMRIYGSMIDLFPSRADVRRIVGQRLQTIGSQALPLAIDTFEKAISARPDHAVGYRLLAMALLQHGDARRAFETLEDALRARVPNGRFAGYQKLAMSELEIVGSIWAAKEPANADAIDNRLDQLNLQRGRQRSALVVLHWETDTSDVDLHVEAMPVQFDVDDGYGPEYAILRGTAVPDSVRIKAHQYDRGAVGYAAGVAQILVHDGNGDFSLTTRPILLMRDRGVVDLGATPIDI